MIYASWIETHFGPLVALSKGGALCLLEFAKAPILEVELGRLSEKTGVEIFEGREAVLSQIKTELNLYFKGDLKKFSVPYSLEFGTPFQKSVWKELLKIPYGQTKTYAELASAVGNPKACRAVGAANRVNPLTIVVPCHRVVNTGDKIGGYAGGQNCKRWLLEHEKKYTE